MSNHLANEYSPYLQQHKDNPVDWYTWGDEAFAKAKEENKAIFLSIGYSACHWCHVMERESFENEEIAKLLNDNFVSIKVDKEERPDIDRYFQEVFVTMNGRAGGWPLSIFMTADKIPFYSATYIPPEPRYGMMGFKELIKVISKQYKKDKNSLIEKGKEVLNFLRPKRKIEATKIDERLEQIVIKQIKQVYEPQFGGFGSAPKFPHSSTLKLAIDLYKLNSDEELKSIIIHTLDSMTAGGLYDIVDGGFCRYSVDNEWLVPHFEKMAYDNALMADVLIRAWRVFEIERYKNIAFETLDFMIDKMMENNLFFSASDADSNGIEGEYFIFDYDEVISEFKANGIKEPIETAKRLSITPNGNFEKLSIARFVNIEDRDDKEILKALDILKDIRKKRDYPFIDKKVQSSWNAMMISALFVAGAYERRYKEQAIASLKALESSMAEGVRVYHSTLIGNIPKGDGYLEDYAWWINALVEGYETTLDERYLIRAIELINEAIRRFYADGKWRVDDGEFKQFAEDTDTSYPSSVAVMVDTLLSIRILADSIYEKFAFRTMEVHSYDLMRQPISRPVFVEASLRYIKGDLLIKAKEKNLESHIQDRLDFKYPWVYYKTVLEDSYQLCGVNSCFASFESFEDIKKEIDKISKA